MRAASLVVAAAALAAPGRPAAAQHPAWAELEGMVVGGAVDAVFALGFECVPGRLPPGVPAAAFAAMLFGSTLPHPHFVDSASARALERGTVCSGRIWGDSAMAFVFAVERRIAALTVAFTFGDRGMSVPDVRRRLHALWGRGSGPPQLEEWGGTRFRAYLMDGFSRRAALYDVRACTAFERLVHELGETGRAERC